MNISLKIDKIRGLTYLGEIFMVGLGVENWLKTNCASR